MVHKSLIFKIRHRLNINCKDVESVSIEVISNTVQNTLFTVLYKPPNSLIDPFESFFKKAFSKTKNATEMYHVAGDFNLNLLD